MTAEEYSEKVERELIENFLKAFYEKVGYYPTVLTRSDLEEKMVNNLSLEELSSYFEPHLPEVFGKRLKLSSKVRVRELVELRQMFCTIARSMNFSLKTIGNFLGKRDHTTIIHSLRTFANLMETDPTYKEKYIKILNEIKEDAKYRNSPTLVSNNKV